ncbi:MAG: hypothetical protein BGO54_13860 [Sphingobacteriales bacterium 46-32]|nr:MAG: hypothetical protein BGO54_13860 [Sphingobacteriales bacterium 46-32]
MSKTFTTLSQSECRQVFQSILNDSEELWESGKILADNKRFGHAIPFLINSIEEQIKALILFLDGEGFSFRQTKGVDTFFRNHEIRHALAYLMFVMNLFGGEVLKFLQQVRDNPEKLLQLRNEIISTEDYIEKKLKFYLFRKAIYLKQEYQWFSKLDLFRQDGFYSKYDGTLKLPMQIGANEFDQHIQRLQKTKQTIAGLIEAFQTTDPGMKNHIAELRKDCIRKKYYEKISAVLTKLRQDRGSAFEHFATNLNKTIKGE